MVVVEAVKVIEHIHDRVVLGILGKPGLFAIAAADPKLAAERFHANEKKAGQDNNTSSQHTDHFPPFIDPVSPDGRILTLD